MYDGAYQLGAEATGVKVDSCTFTAYTTLNYYLAGHAKNCDTANQDMIHISNSTFYNYGESGFRLGSKNAGIAGHTIFYNNRFYSKKEISFKNGFESNCNADAGRNKFSTMNK